MPRASTVGRDLPFTFRASLRAWRRPARLTPRSVNGLTQVTYPDGQTEAFTYDAAGNRLSRSAGGTTTSYSYDDAGQLISDGTNTYGTSQHPPPDADAREPSVSDRCAVTQDVSSAAVRTTRATGVRPRPRLTRPHRLVRPAAALARSR